MVTKIPLSEQDPNAELVLPDGNSIETAPAVLILPGGGYKELSMDEQTLAVDLFQKNGFHAFVLHYSVMPYAHYPLPLLEVSKAVWYLRSHAEELHIDPDMIVICGFSAGAHLTLMYASLWNTDICRNDLDIPEGGNKPNATVTGYSPTTFEDFFEKIPAGIFTEEGTPLSGPKNLVNLKDEHFAKISSLTVTRYVNEDNPPAFLWKTTADAPTSTTEYYRCLRKLNIPCEIHIFEDDRKCAVKAIGTDDTAYSENTKLWGILAINWIKRRYELEKNKHSK